MVEVIGVRYRRAGHIYYFSPGQTKFAYNDYVLVESQQAKYMAQVAIPNKEMAAEDLPEDLKPVLHRATEAEILQDQRNKADAKEALILAKE